MDSFGATSTLGERFELFVDLLNLVETYALTQFRNKPGKYLT